MDYMKEDRQLSKDIATVKALLEDGAIVRNCGVGCETVLNIMEVLSFKC